MSTCRLRRIVLAYVRVRMSCYLVDFYYAIDVELPYHICNRCMVGYRISQALWVECFVLPLFVGVEMGHTCIDSDIAGVAASWLIALAEV